MTRARIASEAGALPWVRGVQHILSPAPALRVAGPLALPICLATTATVDTAPAVARRRRPVSSPAVATAARTFVAPPLRAICSPDPAFALGLRAAPTLAVGAPEAVALP